MSGVVLSTFIVVFREALEAGLIVGIILTLLSKMNAARYMKHVLAGVAAALLLSWGLGNWLSSLTEDSQGVMGPIIEGGISLAACGVLTYMFFWMEKQARHLKSDIEIRVETALSAQDHAAFVSLPFFAVLREGAETVLFLKAVSIQSGGSVSWAGGLSGAGLAVAASVFIFVGGKKVPVRLLFRVTGLLIVFIAAGLLGYGLHELGEIGWIPVGVEHLYDMNHVLDEKTGLGSFLKALFGYNGNPSLTETLAYWAYLVAMLALSFRPKGAAVASRR
jgi:high-affinity iron transporter